METTRIGIKDWTQIVANTDSNWIIQNIGDTPIIIGYTDGAVPSTGMELQHNEGLTSSIHGIGNIYAKTKSGSNGVVALTK